MRTKITWIVLGCLLMNGLLAGCTGSGNRAESGNPTGSPAPSTAPQQNSEEPGNTSKIVYVGKEGKMVYEAHDDKGNRIPDFSSAGYMGGGVQLPEVPVKVTLSPQEGSGDDTGRILDAINEVGKMEPDKNGIRGAVMLKKGQYRIGRTLAVTRSGVVLRGEGQGEDGTVLIATGKKQYDMIKVGAPWTRTEVTGSRKKITDKYVPVGATMLEVENASGFKAGDDIVVLRPSTKEWIHELGMDSGVMTKPGITPWKAGDYDMHFERKVVKVEGNKITLDVPVVQSMDEKYGGGFVYKYTEPSHRTTQVGFEKLRMVSEYDKAKGENDENHGWIAINLENVKNAWVKQVTSKYFGYSCVSIEKGSKWVTVQDSSCLEPISQLTGGRRYSFVINGQMSLVQRCYSFKARHDFVLQSKSCGPNVFLDCKAENSYSTSEPHHRWSVGALYDNVSTEGPGGFFMVANRGDSGTGHGWAGAQVLFWNCKAPLIAVMKPPTEQNFAIGVSGVVRAPNSQKLIADNARWIEKQSGKAFTLLQQDSSFLGDGYFESPTGPVSPKSLYRKQLEDRLGKKAVENIK